jgi:hypothetical protein
VALLYAPLTEEPAKLWPLLLPWLRRSVVADRPAAVRLGMALGLGFGIGEAGLIAHWVAQDPDLRELPFHVFTGYQMERLLVCLMHGAFTATVVVGLATGRSLVPRFLGAMLLHLVGNAPILVLALLREQLGAELVAQLLFLWVLAYAGAMGWLLARYYREDPRVAPLP